MIVPVILSGGAGTRLWPLSRELHPKQLLPLTDSQTMLQETIVRLEGISGIEPPLVVCNDAHRFMVGEQLRQISVEPEALILEPFGRNTAPAVALAAIAALDDRRGNSADRDPVLLVLPADHVIKDVSAFQRVVAVGSDHATAGKLVTFGVVPKSAETGYGYIRCDKQGGPAFAVQEFVEKPDQATAGRYVASGDYYWNSGMFMFRAQRYLEELGRFAADIRSACQKSFDAATLDLDFTRIGEKEFAACRSDSIDYAVMEKTEDAVVVPLDAGWSDVGSWAALHEALTADRNGNVISGDVLTENTRNCYVYSGSRLVATVGLDEHVVVETKDAVLVAHKDQVQDVKALVDQLKQQGRYESALHREVFRPWGSYDSLDQGERFQVKRLVVNPGAVLSLQMHHHRAEHWVVVSGTAKITRGDEEFLLEENQSTYIPIGTAHRIENPGQIPLHIIEVQSGSYLGEDDIVRFEDNYGREGTNK